MPQSCQPVAVWSFEYRTALRGGYWHLLRQAGAEAPLVERLLVTRGLMPQPYIEVRPLRRGPLNQFNAVLGLVALVAAWEVPELPVYWRVGLSAVAVVLVLPILLSVVTVVSLGRVQISIGPLRRWSATADEVSEMEIVVSDHLVQLFGGWNVRTSLAGAMAATVEGDRSVGNRSVRLTLATGKIRQVGTFRPHALVAAVEAEKARISRT